MYSLDKMQRFLLFDRIEVPLKLDNLLQTAFFHLSEPGDLIIQPSLVVHCVFTKPTFDDEKKTNVVPCVWLQKYRHSAL